MLIFSVQILIRSCHINVNKMSLVIVQSAVLRGSFFGRVDLKPAPELPERSELVYRVCLHRVQGAKRLKLFGVQFVGWAVGTL